MNRSAVVLSAALVGLVLSGGAWASGEPVVTPAQIEAAKTSADHEAIAKAYEEEAARLEAKAKEHVQMAAAYLSPASKKGPETAAMHAHCAKLARQYADAAKENRALADAHRAMEKECCKEH